MKTLKQLLNESGYTPYALCPDDISHWNEEQFIINIVKQWLTQKRELYPRDENADVVFTDLLKELQQ